MNDVIMRGDCTGCMACYNICPKKAIKMIQGQDGFYYPTIDEDLCIHCGLCKKICPVIKEQQAEIVQTEIYCCKNKNQDIRMKSSSGGIFTLIAESILDQNGIVFGVRFSKDMDVIHDYVQTKQELELFRGSKYVQSKIGDTYKQAKQFLEQGRKVLYTGTPCQIEGLLSYLGKEYDNLYTQDIICHGVPSPKVWKKYMEYKKKVQEEYPKKVNFRKKELSGWSDFQVSYEYNKKEENIHHDDDPYMKLFLRNFDLRKSCYHCHFKKVNREADITLADFWGINEVNPHFNDEKGVSAILLHTSKGKEIFENIKDKLEFFKADLVDVIKHNSPLCESVTYNDAREEFFKDLDNYEFEFLIQKYLLNEII